jgi:hypothetical protein
MLALAKMKRKRLRFLRLLAASAGVRYNI